MALDKITLPDGWLLDALDNAVVSIACMNPHVLDKAPGWVPKRLREQVREKYRKRFRWHTGEDL